MGKIVTVIKTIQPIFCFICLFQCNAKFVDEIRTALCKFALSDVCSYTCTASIYLLGNDMLVLFFYQILIEKNHSVRKIL